jgi:hypothetical protein
VCEDVLKVTKVSYNMFKAVLRNIRFFQGTRGRGSCLRLYTMLLSRFVRRFSDYSICVRVLILN